MQLQWRHCEEAEREHERNERQYAHTYHYADTICVCRAFWDLPKSYRDGVLLHELGHLLAGEQATEDEATMAAERYFRVPIEYVDSPYGRDLERLVNMQGARIVNRQRINPGDVETMTGNWFNRVHPGWDFAELVRDRMDSGSWTEHELALTIMNHWLAHMDARYEDVLRDIRKVMARTNPDAGIDKYQIAANVELEGLDGFKGVMSAAMQRRVFGANLFGRKTIRVDASGQGEVSGWFKVAFGQDFNSFRFSFQEIADAVNSGKRLRF